MSKVSSQNLNLKFVILLTCYFVYVLLLIKITIQNVNQIYLLLGSMPLFIYSLFKVISSSRYRKILKKVSIIILVFYLLIFLLTAYNIGVINRGITWCLIFIIHVLFITLLNLNKGAETIQNLTFTFLLISIFVVFIPHYYITQSIKLGSFYNLMSPRLLTSTTIESPLIVSILFVLSSIDIFINKRKNFINVFSFLIALFILLLFSRRGFIFASIISVTLYYFYTKNKNALTVYGIFFLLFVPMLWDYIYSLIIVLFELDIVKAFVVRSSSEELISATGRLFTWNNILQLFFTFDTKYIFGIPGGPPQSLFLVSEEENRYNHAHNTILQIFIEAGYIMILYFILMMVHFFNKLLKISEKKTNSNVFFAIIIFLFSLSSTETLINSINFSSFIFCYALIGFGISLKNT